MNKKLFQSSPSLVVPTDTTNNAGGAAYSLPPEEALAQIAVTGFFGDTFYVSAADQLKAVLELAPKCTDEFVAQVARYARGAGHMKDAPAVLLAYLFGKRSEALTEDLFREVIGNVKMLSNFVRAVRSGQFGRRSLGSRAKRWIAGWLNSCSVDYLWKQSIAKDPSLGDIIKLTHPRPLSLDMESVGMALDMESVGMALDRERAALYRMLIGKPAATESLPQLVQDTLAFRADQTKALPDVPFNMVDAVPLTTAHWAQLFANGNYMFTRMNLNTAQRHGALKDKDLVRTIAARLSDKEQVVAAKQFPYQLLTAFSMIAQDIDMPHEIKVAMAQALDHSLANVPQMEGEVYVAVDCSGSMASPATGERGAATSKVTFSDVASLFAAALLRRNPQTRVMTFSDHAVFVPCNPLDQLATTAARLSNAGGGTDCSAPLRLLAAEKRKVDLFVLISDNESWLDGGGGYRAYVLRARQMVQPSTGTVAAWDEIKRHSPNAKQVRINISPNGTDQLPKRADTLRVAGFSDAVFTAVAAWLQNKDWASCIRDYSR